MDAFEIGFWSGPRTRRNQTDARLGYTARKVSLSSPTDILDRVTEPGTRSEGPTDWLSDLNEPTRGVDVLF